jgi:hypothetical protein
MFTRKMNLFCATGFFMLYDTKLGHMIQLETFLFVSYVRLKIWLQDTKFVFRVNNPSRHAFLARRQNKKNRRKYFRPLWVEKEQHGFA